MADAIFILNRGCVRISVVNPTGREKIVGLFKTGDVFGELGQHEKRKVQATAHEECWVSVVSRDNFLRMMSLKPELALNLIEILTQKLAEAREDIGALTRTDLEMKVILAGRNGFLRVSLSIRSRVMRGCGGS